MYYIVAPNTFKHLSLSHLKCYVSNERGPRMLKFSLYSKFCHLNFVVTSALDIRWRQRKRYHDDRGVGIFRFQECHGPWTWVCHKPKAFDFEVKIHDIVLAALPDSVDPETSWSSISGSNINRSNPGTGVAACGTTGWFAWSKLHCFSWVNWVNWNVVR